MNPKVSFIITVYNGSAYLRDTLTAVLFTKWDNFDVIVADDGSEDESLVIANMIAKADSRVRTLSLGRVGRAVALNKAIESSNAAFIAILDADDLSLPDRLSLTIPILVNDSRIKMVGSRALSAPSNLALKEYSDYSPSENDPSYTFIFPTMLYKKNYFVHSSVVFRRSDWITCGGYDQSLKMCLDYEFYFRLIGRSYSALIDAPLVIFRHTPQTHFKRMRDRDYLLALNKCLKSARNYCDIPMYLRIWDIKPILTVIKSRLNQP